MKQFFFQKIKEVSFILFGALLGTYFLFIEKILKSSVWLVVFLLIILFALGLGLADWLYKKCLDFMLWFNTQKKRIGVYAPYDIDTDTSSWINLSIRQLEQELKSQKIKYKKIVADNDFIKYPVIVNPYGGVYPENDISTLESLQRILEYVRKGGIYVNIADIPFFYAFDKNLKRRIWTTPTISPLTEAVSFQSLIVVKKLKISILPVDRNTWKVDYGPDKNRVIALNDMLKNFYAEEIQISGEPVKYSPFVAIPYGKGWFVFSTFVLGKHNKDHLNQIIDKSIGLIKND